WARLDQLAATAWLRVQYPDHRLAIVAHSFGGQILGLSPLVREVSAILMVTVAHGYWRRWTGLRRWREALRAFFIIPLQLAMHGYVAKGLGSGMQLSRQAGRDFMRFQANPGFLCDEAGKPLRPYNADV